jgi:hypothetical protein
VTLFVVVDLMGAGRVVGVFEREAAARRVIGDFPQYYKVWACDAPDRLTGDVFVVWDRQGMGSLAGIYGSPAEAKGYSESAYHQVHAARLNEINRECLAWTVNDEQRAHLMALLADPA